MRWKACASITCTPPGRRRSSSPAAKVVSSPSRYLPVPPSGSRSRRDARISCPSFFRISRPFSSPDESALMLRSCRSPRRTSMVAARWEPPWIRPRRRPIPPASSSPKSTSGCRGRTGTRWCRSIGSPPSSTRIAPSSNRSPSRRRRWKRASARSSRGWSRTARRCRWGSERYRTRRSTACERSGIWGFTRRCSRIAWWSCSKPARSPTGSRASIRIASSRVS